MCDSMPGTFHNLLLQHRSVTGDDEHGCFLIFSVKCVDRLCGNELENDGIHRSLKSKQKTCGCKYHHIDTKNKIPGRFMQSGGKINRNKIRSTAGSFSEQSNRVAVPFKIPPNTDTKSGSYVIGVTGIRSTRKEFSTIISTVYEVNFLPIHPKTDDRPVSHSMQY